MFKKVFKAPKNQNGMPNFDSGFYSKSNNANSSNELSKKDKKEEEKKNIELTKAQRKQAEKERKKQEEELRKKQQKAANKKKNAVNQETANTTQSTIPYRKVYKNGIIETAKGVYTKSYALKDINYQIAQEEDQITMFVNYCKFLNSFDTSVKIQITINNRNIDREQFESETLLAHKGNHLDQYIDEYNEMLVEKMSEGKNNMTRERYVTVAVEAENFSSACNLFARLDTDIPNQVKKIGDCEAKILGTGERLKVLHDLLNVGHENEFHVDEDVEEWLNSLAMRGLDTKDVIIPDGIQFKGNYMMIGDKFARVLYLNELPTQLTDNVLSELTDSDFNMITSLNLAPMPQDQAVKVVRHQITNINSAIMTRQQKAAKDGVSGDLINPELKKAAEDAHDLLNDLTSKNQKMFLMTMVIMHYADTLEQLDRDSESIITIGRKYVCQIKKLSSQQELGFKSVLPLCYNQLHLKRTLTTESTAILIPFTSQEMFQKGGTYYGLNAISRNIILFNRENCHNGNGFILGTPGCVDRETEFFNGSEWKSIADYIEGEKVLQFNTETNEASLVLPERYIKEKCDLMYHFETSKGINQTLSPEHRVLYYNRDTHNGGYHKEVQEVSAEELAVMQNAGKFRGKFKTDFMYDGPGIKLSDIEIKIMLAVICDGHFNKNNPNSLNCVFNLKKQRKKDEMFALLTEYGKHFHMSGTADGYTHYSFNVPRREKVFTSDWYNCSKEQLQLICDNILKWDGRVDGKGRMSFSTTIKENADFVQFAFSACGYRASIKVNDRRGQTHKANGKEYVRKSIEYTVLISDVNMVGMAYHPERDNNVTVETVTPVDGMKYCFTVPTHALVLRRNGNIFITGNSGKSFTVKQEIVNIILNTNDDVIIIDPENEYRPLVEILLGEVISIKAGGKNYINTLDMDAEYAGEDASDPISLKVDFMLSVFKTIIGKDYTLTPSQKSIINRAVKQIYKEYIKSEKIDEFGKKTYDETKLPTLTDLQKFLNHQREREAQELALDLELFSEDGFDNFAHYTNVDTNNRLLCYDIRDVNTSMMDLSMLVVMDSVWQRILKNHRLGKKTWVYIDEAHLLFKNEVSADFLNTLYKRSRKFNGYITSITQNVEDILRSDICRTMISNAHFNILLNQATIDRNQLAILLKISDTQLSHITGSSPGEGLLIANQKNIIPFINKFPEDTALYKAMTTKPSDIKAYKIEQQKKQQKLKEKDK